jgi:hypothetical protein
MAVGTEEPTADTTVEPITPTVVTDQGRGDSLLRFPSDYKSNLYGEDKSYHKGLSPYKSYEVLDGAKRMAYDMTNGNEVEKGLKVYKVSLPLSPLICSVYILALSVCLGVHHHGSSPMTSSVIRRSLFHCVFIYISFNLYN